METKRNIPLVIALICGALLICAGIYLFKIIVRPDYPVPTPQMPLLEVNAVASTTYSDSDNAATGTPMKMVIEELGISFSLPAGYGVFRTIGGEGGYGSWTSIGKEEKPGQYADTGIKISISAVPGTDGNISPMPNKPSTYIDAVEKYYAKIPYAKVAIFNAFGNKAIRYLDLDQAMPQFVGFLRPDQIYGDIAGYGDMEYSVQVKTSTYGTNAKYDEKVFNMILDTLKIEKK